MALIAIVCLAIMTSDQEESKMSAVYHQGHEPISTIAFSADGKLLAIGSQESKISIWDVAKRKEWRSLSGHEGEIECVVFSPTGKLLASASSDKTIRLWRVADGECIGVLKGHEDRVTSVVFLTGGELLASCSPDKNIRIWQVDNGRLLRTLPQPQSIRCIAYEPKQSLLASGEFDGKITLWDAKTWSKVRDLPKRTYLVSSIAFSPDGSTMGSAGSRKDPEWTGSVDLWSAVTGKHLCTFDHPKVHVVSFAPDGATLGSGGFDHAIKLWDLKSRKLMTTIDEFDAPTKFVNRTPWGIGSVITLAFAPKDHLLVSGGGTSIGKRRLGELIFWNLDKLKR